MWRSFWSAPVLWRFGIVRSRSHDVHTVGCRQAEAKAAEDCRSPNLAEVRTRASEVAELAPRRGRTFVIKCPRTTRRENSQSPFLSHCARLLDVSSKRATGHAPS